MIFAFLDVNPERITAFLMACLATAGGGLAGFILFSILSFMIDRKVTGGKSPEGLKKTINWLGGVIGAVLVAFIMFGQFGTGDGNGNGDGSSATTTTNTGTGNTNTTAPTTAPTTTEPPPIIELAPKDELIRITVLSGAAVKDEKFYLIESDRTPRNLSEVKDAASQRKKATMKKVAVEIRLGERTDRNNSGVLDLEGWALADGYQVILPGSGK